LTACFPKLGVHVPLTIFCHSENEYLEKIKNPKVCDGSCCFASGHMQDFGIKQSDSDTSYRTDKIIQTAKDFLKAKKSGRSTQLKQIEIQLNGKYFKQFNASKDYTNEELEATARVMAKFVLKDVAIKKIIVVPKKLVNFVF
jgi:glycyl-tRNA synthetase (class II)